MEAHRYVILVVQTIIALLATIYINLHGRFNEFHKALVSPLFYISFLLSFIIALLMLFYIDMLSTNLSKRYPFAKNKLFHLIWHLILGVTAPTIANLILMMGFYTLSGRNLLDTYYINDDLPIVFFYLLFINGFYFVWNILKPFIKGHQTPDTTEPQTETQSGTDQQYLLVYNYQGTTFKLHIPSEVLYIYTEARNTKVFTVKGNEYFCAKTLAGLLKDHSAVGLCQVNPSAIINLLALKGHTPGNRSKTLMPVFKAEHDLVMSTRNLDTLRITRKYIPDLKSRFNSHGNYPPGQNS
ncbi:LytTR family DNA-binding domain-containing protein [Pedobacter sp.]